MNFTKDTKISLNIEEFKIGPFQQGQPVVLLYRIKNASKFTVSNVKVVLLNEGRYQIKILHETLEEMINGKIVEGISNNFGAKANQHSDQVSINLKFLLNCVPCKLNILFLESF